MTCWCGRLITTFKGGGWCFADGEDKGEQHDTDDCFRDHIEALREASRPFRKAEPVKKGRVKA